MSAFKFTTLFCAAALMFTANRADATDTLRLLATVAHLQAESADADLQKVAPQETTAQSTLDGNWSGRFVSDMDGYEGKMEANLKQSADGQLMGILPYIEQDNLYQFRVATGDVNQDGIVDIIAATETERGVTLFMKVDAIYLPTVKTGESPMIVGTYEIISVDARGNTRTVDVGTLGIIAILIGL